MNRPFEVHLPQDKIALRRVLFAVELLDAVTLNRVSQGVDVKAHGLQGKPIVNTSGLFVWLNEDITQLERISIDPRTLPYEKVKLEANQLQLPLTYIELPPRVDYPFGAGITGLRGTLVEERGRPDAVSNAEVWLLWLDQDGSWHEAPTRSHTTAIGGDFVAILRLAPTDEPLLANRKLTVRVRFKRGDNERSSDEQQLLQGQVTNPSTLEKSIFAWDELEQ